MMTDQIDEKDTSNGVEGTVGVKRRILPVLDGTVCVYEAGDPNRSAIVLLHGAMYDESRFIWDALSTLASRIWTIGRSARSTSRS